MKDVVGFCSLDEATRQGHGDPPAHQGLDRAGPPGPSKSSSQRSLTLTNRPPPRRVDHIYRDYSNCPLGELPARKRAPTNFPSKLHHILSTPEFSHIISWMPHGRAWKIHNKELLVREVVPKYFVQSKYESFTRQLNGWGFKRLHQSGNDYNACYHECFLRGLPHLIVLMKRVPPNKGKLIPHVEGEPNFYAIDMQFPLPPPVLPYHPQPESPRGYNCPNNYASYPGNYPPPPAYYASDHVVGHHAPAAFVPQAGYPPCPYYSTRYSQPVGESYHRYPHSPGGPYGTPSHNDYSMPKRDSGIVNTEQVPSDPAPRGPAQEESLPIEDEATDNSLGPLSIFPE